jgi:hypothetical protein
VPDGFDLDFITSLFRCENRVCRIWSTCWMAWARRRRDHLTAARRVTGEAHRRCVKVRFTSMGITGEANRECRVSTQCGSFEPAVLKVAYGGKSSRFDSGCGDS